MIIWHNFQASHIKDSLSALFLLQICLHFSSMLHTVLGGIFYMCLPYLALIKTLLRIGKPFCTCLCLLYVYTCAISAGCCLLTLFLSNYITHRHPTSSASAAEIMSVLFFHVMHYSGTASHAYCTGVRLEGWEHRDLPPPWDWFPLDKVLE